MYLIVARKLKGPCTVAYNQTIDLIPAISISNQIDNIRIHYLHTLFQSIRVSGVNCQAQGYLTVTTLAKTAAQLLLV